MNDLPENIEINGIVAMNQPITQSDDLAPWYLRILRAFVRRRPACGFPDDFEQPN